MAASAVLDATESFAELNIKAGSSMKKTGNTIMQKWTAATEANGGCFVRYLDGNEWNVEHANQEFVHPFEAFSAMYHRLGWVVDWTKSLTEAEVAFVQENVWNFCVTYQAYGCECLSPSGACTAPTRITKPPKHVRLCAPSHSCFVCSSTGVL